MLQTIEVEIDTEGNVPAPAATGKGIESVFGILKAGKGVSLEAMDAAIHQRAVAGFLVATSADIQAAATS